MDTSSSPNPYGKDRDALARLLASKAFDVPDEQTYDRRLDQTWPGRLAQEAWGAVLAPGRALQATEPITSEQMIKPAADLAGLVTGGSYAKPAMKDASGMGIRAYHSSPHDFDKFDLAKIGSGEGAQMYGHGLYFAENPAVSGLGGSYWSQFLHRFPEREQFAADILRYAKGDRAYALDISQQAMDTLRREIATASPKAVEQYLAPSLQKRMAAHEILKAKGETGQIGPRTYEVDINADPAHMLDWDKPLRTQTESLRDALGFRMTEQLGPSGYLMKSDRLGGWHDPEKTGGAFYQGFRDKVAATEALREAGIPGIRYLDEGSRNAQPVLKTSPSGEVLSSQYPPPTRNYVIFDPNRIRIDKKYVLPTAGTAAGALATRDREE